MSFNLKGRSFLKLLDFSKRDLTYILDLARDLKNPRLEAEAVARLGLSAYLQGENRRSHRFFNEALEQFRRQGYTEKLAGLRTVFSKGADATMTAGNSTPLTDGAASVLLASEAWAKNKNLPVSAYLSFAVGAVSLFYCRLHKMVLESGLITITC